MAVAESMARQWAIGGIEHSPDVIAILTNGDGDLPPDDRYRPESLNIVKNRNGEGRVVRPSSSLLRRGS